MDVVTIAVSCNDLLDRGKSLLGLVILLTQSCSFIARLLRVILHFYYDGCKQDLLPHCKFLENS